MVSSVRDLGLLLKTVFNADDNVARGMFSFYRKRSFATLTPSIFLLLKKAFIRPHLEYAEQASSPILSRDCQALENVQKLAVKFVKGLRHVPYEAVMLLRFTNGGVKPVAANMRSAFEQSRT